jgi:hypothetical protein
MNLVVVSASRLRNVADGDIARRHGEKDLCEVILHSVLLAPPHPAHARAGSSAPADRESWSTAEPLQGYYPELPGRARLPYYLAKDVKLLAEGWRIAD